MCRVSRGEGVHTSVTCGRWGFNSKVMRVLARNVTCGSNTVRTSILFEKVICASGSVLGSYCFCEHVNTLTVHMHWHEWQCACVCCKCTDRCSIIQSISLGVKLWERTRRDFFPHTPRPPPPPAFGPLPTAKILPELPWGGGEGKRDLEERGESTTTTAVSKSQQPGEGLWVIFYGWRGTTDVHLFISAVSIEGCVCVPVCVKICHGSLFTFTGKSLRSLVTLECSEIMPQPVMCTYDE